MSSCPKCGHLNPEQTPFCSRCGTALAATDIDAAPETPDLTGRLLQARYQVEAKLGEGGMGAVYRAQDTRLGRKVALKVLAADLVAHPTARRRMTQEANALARIEHGHVVRVFDVFDEDQQLVIVMELVTGGDLSKSITRGGLPVDEVVRLVDGILAGLGAIHAAGLVHRDMKPENVLLTAERVPKITDLGVARDSQASQKTQMGARLGTPEYMSPEQAQGLQVDARSDLYAVGLVLFELLTGSRPFVGTSEIELLAARVQQPPNLSALAGRCSQAMQQVIATSLAREVQFRYESAEAMRQALLAAASGPISESVIAVAAPAPVAAAPAPSAIPAPVPAPAAVPAPAFAPPSPASVPAPPSNRTGLLLGVAALVLLGGGAAVVMSRNGNDSGAIAEPALPEPRSSAPLAAAPVAVAAGGSAGGEAAAAAAPAVDKSPFFATSELCEWSMSQKSNWLKPDMRMADELHLTAIHGFTILQGARERNSVSKIILKGARPTEITLAGKELLTVKAYAAAQRDVEWVFGFWNSSSIDEYGDFYNSNAAITISRLTRAGVETRVQRMATMGVFDELDGHFLQINVKPEWTANTCVVLFGAHDGGEGKRSKANHEYWVTLPVNESDGWPQNVGSSTWGTFGPLTPL